MKNLLKRIINTNILWIPILIYAGNRSYISQDEGFYALQARWIIEKGNWIAPMWWDQISFDRTIGIQWLIAISQSVFGQTILAAHIPSLICAFICLIVTYKISIELIGEEYSWLSPILLLTTYLWVNNAHLATQDMPLLALEILGIYSLIKAKDNTKINYLFISGLWIGLCLLIKSVMILVPLISISPYVYFYRKHVFSSKYFWFGLFIGFIPMILWLSLSLKSYGSQAILSQINKLGYLKSSNAFSKPFYYYLWNIPANTFPWGILSILGSIKILLDKNLKKILILVIYPIIMIIILTIFNTKTPYYALQITPFIAINSNLAMQVIFSSKNKYKNLIKKSLSFVGLVIFSIAIYISILNVRYGFSNISKHQLLFNLLLFIIGSSLICLYFIKNQKRLLIIGILGPYLSYLIAIQSGFFCDRSEEIRLVIEDERISEILQSNKVNFYFSNELNDNEYSKLIKLALYAPDLGSKLNNLSELSNNDLVWVNKTKNIPDKNNFNIVFQHEKLHPWILLKQK